MSTSLATPPEPATTAREVSRGKRRSNSWLWRLKPARQLAHFRTGQLFLVGLRFGNSLLEDRFGNRGDGLEAMRLILIYPKIFKFHRVFSLN